MVTKEQGLSNRTGAERLNTGVPCTVTHIHYSIFMSVSLEIFYLYSIYT